jgi:hypothetical protein
MTVDLDAFVSHVINCSVAPDCSQNLNVYDLDILLWFFIACFGVLNLMYHIQTLNCTAEDCVFIVEPGLSSCQRNVLDNSNIT